MINKINFSLLKKIFFGIFLFLFYTWNTFSSELCSNYNSPDWVKIFWNSNDWETYFLTINVDWLNINWWGSANWKFDIYKIINTPSWLDEKKDFSLNKCPFEKVASSSIESNYSSLISEASNSKSTTTFLNTAILFAWTENPVLNINKNNLGEFEIFLSWWVSFDWNMHQWMIFFNLKTKIFDIFKTNIITANFDHDHIYYVNNYTSENLKWWDNRKWKEWPTAEELREGKNIYGKQSYGWGEMQTIRQNAYVWYINSETWYKKKWEIITEDEISTSNSFASKQNKISWEVVSNNCTWRYRIIWWKNKEWEYINNIIDFRKPCEYELKREIIKKDKSWNIIYEQECKENNWITIGICKDKIDKNWNKIPKTETIYKNIYEKWNYSEHNFNTNWYNILWWYVNSNQKTFLILQDKTNLNLLSIWEINWNIKNKIRDINLWEIKYHIWTSLYCDNNSICKLWIIWGSDKSKNNTSDFYINTTTEKIRNDLNFYKWISIFSWKNLSDFKNYELDKSIFWYKNLAIWTLERWWIINPIFFINKYWDIIFTEFEKKIELTSSSNQLDSCEFIESWAGFFLRKKEYSVIHIEKDQNWEYWTWIYLKWSFEKLVPKNLISIFLESIKDIKSNLNNIIQYPVWDKIYLKEWKNIISCATSNKSNIWLYIYTTPVANLNRYMETKLRLIWRAFLAIWVKSWFYDSNWNIDNSQIKLSPIQSLKKNNEISFWWNFNFTNNRKILDVFIKEEWEWSNLCILSWNNCQNTKPFKWFNEEFFQNYLEIKNRKSFLHISQHEKLPEPWDFCIRWRSPLVDETVCSEEKIEPLSISFYTWSSLNNTDITKWSIISDNFEPISNNWNIWSWSFLIQKKFEPWYHKIHMMIATQPDNQTINEAIIWSKLRWDWWYEFDAQKLVYYSDFWWLRRDTIDYKTEDFWLNKSLNELPESLDIEYQAYVYEFYIPEITNIDEEWDVDKIILSWGKPLFSWINTVENSQLFFYTWENQNSNFRLNDISKNNIKFNNQFNINWSNNNFSSTSNEIKNIVEMVDNSSLHHKIRSTLNWDFSYSPIYNFPKEKDNYLKYFYIDRNWNIIWWKEVSFKISEKGAKIKYYNKIENNIIITDSVKPFIYWNYKPDFALNWTLIWNWQIQEINIKTDYNWDFIFQPKNILTKWVEYSLDFWIWNNFIQKIKINNNKNIPEIISHKNWDIEISKKPFFYWNWKENEDLIIEVFTENQVNLNEQFSEIKCSNILDSNNINPDLNNWNSFIWTKIYSCSQLWQIWNITSFFSTSVKTNKDWNWTWQLEKELEEQNLDSKNIYFIKIYYKNEDNYNLKSFRYFPKKDFSTFDDIFSSNWNYLKETDWNTKIQIDLKNLFYENNKNYSEIEIIDKSLKWKIKIFSWIDNNLDFWIKIPSFSWIKVWEWITSTWILIEKWMRIYNSLSWKLELNQENKIFNLKKWDKIFSWAKESKIKFYKNLEIFSYGKIKIFPDTKKISIEFDKNLDFYLEDSDKINLSFFEEVKNYFTNNSWISKKYTSNPLWVSNESKLKEYKNNIATILSPDENSSNKNLKFSDSFNWKIVKEWEKILIKWTAWPNTKLKFSINNKDIWSSDTDSIWLFSFYIPQAFEYKNQLLTSSNIIEVRIDNPEEKNLSKKFFITVTKNQTWTYLNNSNLINKDRDFSEKNWFINFSEKIKKLPVFNW